MTSEPKRKWLKWQRNLRFQVSFHSGATPVDSSDFHRRSYDAGWYGALMHVANYMGIRGKKKDGRFESLDDIRTSLGEIGKKI